jgi:hypothetical protein
MKIDIKFSIKYLQTEFNNILKIPYTTIPGIILGIQGWFNINK